MIVLWPIAAITFKEGIRDRALYGITLFALSLLGFSLLLSNMAPRDVGKVAVDMALSTISFAGLLLVLFVGINLMAKDLDKRTIYSVLSRPVSRSEYVVGKFFGLCLLIVAVVVFLSIFALLSILMLKLSYPNYFEKFAWSLVILAITFEGAMLILLSAISFFFASLTSTSFVTLVLTVISYLIGNSIRDVKALVESPAAAGIQISPVMVKTVQAAYYLFPNLSLFDVKIQAAHGLPIPLNYILLLLLYFVVYSSLVITLAALIFRRKEFP
ncbi:MAG: ABC transporter permease [Nitrospirota bacterium]|nr:ABC transporter permease [Nitrospirota bacterium]